MIKRLISIIIIMFFVGCAGLQNKPSVCDTIPTDSYSVICEISAELKANPEDVSNVLKIANVAGLATDKYTAQEAQEFIDDIRSYLKRAQSGYGLLYTTLVKFVEEKYIKLPPEVQAAIIILEPFGDVDLLTIPVDDRVLSDYDFQMFYKHLNDQGMIIAPFLIAK